VQKSILNSLVLSGLLAVSAHANAASEQGYANSNADPSYSAYEHANCNASFQGGCTSGKGNNGKGNGNGNSGSGTVIGSGDGGTPANALPGPEMHAAGPALLVLAGVMLMLRRRNKSADNA